MLIILKRSLWQQRKNTTRSIRVEKGTFYIIFSNVTCDFVSLGKIFQINYCYLTIGQKYQL